MIFVLPFIKKLGIVGITLYPFIFVSSVKQLSNKITINHEKIHLRQQLELLIIPFYFIYMFEYIIGLFVYGNRHDAYKQISSERESYTNDNNLNYLNDRKIWTSFKYFGFKKSK